MDRLAGVHFDKLLIRGTTGARTRYHFAAIHNVSRIYVLGYSLIAGGSEAVNFDLVEFRLWADRSFDVPNVHVGLPASSTLYSSRGVVVPYQTATTTSVEWLEQPIPLGSSFERTGFSSIDVGVWNLTASTPAYLTHADTRFVLILGVEKEHTAHHTRMSESHAWQQAATDTYYQ